MPVNIITPVFRSLLGDGNSVLQEMEDIVSAAGTELILLPGENEAAESSQHGHHARVRTGRRPPWAQGDPGGN